MGKWESPQAISKGRWELRETWRIQVVRAEAGAELRRKAAQNGSAGGVLGSDLLADAMQLAIDHKRTRANPDTVLALDATETSLFLNGLPRSPNRYGR